MGQKIFLTDHAIAEARRRGISEEMLLHVVNTPEQQFEVRLGREIRQSRIKDTASGKLQLIRVVVDRHDHRETVVTVYRTSKVSKYWRYE